MCRGLGGLRVGFARLRMRRRRTLEMEGGRMKAGFGRVGFTFSKLKIVSKVAPCHQNMSKRHTLLITIA